MRNIAQSGVSWGVFAFGWAQRGMQTRGVVNRWGQQCWVATGQHSAWPTIFGDLPLPNHLLKGIEDRSSPSATLGNLGLHLGTHGAPENQTW